MTTTLWVALYLLVGALFAEYVLDLRLVRDGRMRAMSYFWTVTIYPIVLVISIISILIGVRYDD